MPYENKVNYQIRLEDSEVIYHDFRGAPSKFNPSGGRRRVSIELTEPVMIRNRRIEDDFHPVPIQQLIDDGWNVKTVKKREGEEDLPDRYYLECSIAFPRDDDRQGPKIFVVNSGDRTADGKLRANLISESSIGVLDYARILRVDADINPYNWEVRGETGVTAYIDKLYVVIEKSPYDDKYASEEYPRE